MEKEIQIELSAESEVGSGYYYASLELPASREQIKDAQQKARWTDSTTQLRTIGVTSCAVIPNLIFARLDTTSIDEMNFLAHRLESMDASQRLIYHGLYQHLCKDEEFADPLSVKDLINMTYGLDSVMVASNVTNLKELGQFVIDNELNENVNAIPEDSVYLIDLEKLGRLQQSVDDGIFIGNLYIIAGDFEMPSVYDGVHIPELPEVESLPDVIRILTESTPGETQKLAKRFYDMGEQDKLKFKAVLEAENISSTEIAFQKAEMLHGYTLYPLLSDPDTLFKEYLSTHLDTRFDPKWLDTMVPGAAAQHLLERLGAKQTSYGILSAPGHPLFELVTHDAPKGVQQIDVHEIRSLNAMDGIIFQGCGGNLQEWVDGLNSKMTQETVVLLSKGDVDSKKVRVEFSLEDMDMSEFQNGATYAQIKDYVLEHTGLNVSNLYIAQVKKKCGLEVGKNYNLPKSEDHRAAPLCPPEKEEAILAALKHFGMIG